MNIELKLLNKIFNDAFGSELHLNEKTKKEDLTEWDSFNHLNLIVELESQLKITFTGTEIESIDSVNTLKEILKNK